MGRGGGGGLFVLDRPAGTKCSLIFYNMDLAKKPSQHIVTATNFKATIFCLGDAMRNLSPTNEMFALPIWTFRKQLTLSLKI